MYCVAAPRLDRGPAQQSAPRPGARDVRRFDTCAVRRAHVPPRRIVAQARGLLVVGVLPLPGLCPSPVLRPDVGAWPRIPPANATSSSGLPGGRSEVIFGVPRQQNDVTTGDPRSPRSGPSTLASSRRAHQPGSMTADAAATRPSSRRRGSWLLVIALAVAAAVALAAGYALRPTRVPRRGAARRPSWHPCAAAVPAGQPRPLARRTPGVLECPAG